MSPLNITQPLGIWSTRWLLFQVMSNIPKMGQLPTPVIEGDSKPLLNLLFLGGGGQNLRTPQDPLSKLDAQLQSELREVSEAQWTMVFLMVPYRYLQVLKHNNTV